MCLFRKILNFNLLVVTLLNRQEHNSGCIQLYTGDSAGKKKINIEFCFYVGILRFSADFPSYFHIYIKVTFQVLETKTDVVILFCRISRALHICVFLHLHVTAMQYACYLQDIMLNLQFYESIDFILEGIVQFLSRHSFLTRNLGLSGFKTLNYLHLHQCFYLILCV